MDEANVFQEHIERLHLLLDEVERVVQRLHRFEHLLIISEVRCTHCGNHTKVSAA